MQRQILRVLIRCPDCGRRKVLRRVKIPGKRWVMWCEGDDCDFVARLDQGDKPGEIIQAHVCLQELS